MFATATATKFNLAARANPKQNLKQRCVTVKAMSFNDAYQSWDWDSDVSLNFGSTGRFGSRFQANRNIECNPVSTATNPTIFILLSPQDDSTISTIRGAFLAKSSDEPDLVRLPFPC